MRTTLLALLILAAACGDSTQPFIEADAQTPDGGAEDAAPPLADAGEVLDEGALDAGGTRADAGGELDGGEVLVDAGPPCTVVPQSGCPAGFACRYQYVTGPDARRTGIACEVAGTGGDGASCDIYDAGDSCQPGFWCSGLLCRLYCLADDGCPTLSGRARHCEGQASIAGGRCVFTL